MPARFDPTSATNDGSGVWVYECHGSQGPTWIGQGGTRNVAETVRVGLLVQDCVVRERLEQQHDASPKSLPSSIRRKNDEKTSVKEAGEFVGPWSC